jgi:uncharacterized protein (DUF433 family)
MNARLYSIFTQRYVSQERASGQGRPGIKAFACHHISITPGVRSGKPFVKGTRITVSDVLEYLAGGMDEQAILADFPELRREHIRAVRGFAAERERPLNALPGVS